MKIFRKKVNIEDSALRQLEQISQKEGIIDAVGLPDLHAGKGCPIGAAFSTEDRVYPYLIGNDIGCGMALHQLDKNVSKIKRDKLVKKIKNLDNLTMDKDYLIEKKAEYSVKTEDFDYSLGTIGGGNHFAEFLKVSEIFDEEKFDSMNLDKKNLFLLVHSGSRGYGESILSKHIISHKADALMVNSQEFNEYIERHNDALNWAKLNRYLIKEKFINKLGVESKEIYDVFHNYIEDINGLKIHRKGASPSNQGVIVIPGSRGSSSYLVEPIGDQSENLYSLAHGAGRKFKRSEMKDRLKKKYSREDLLITKKGNYVICEDKDLLYEEAPEAYKNIDMVIKDLVELGLIRIIAVFDPVVTYKKEKRKDCC